MRARTWLLAPTFGALLAGCVLDDVAPPEAAPEETTLAVSAVSITQVQKIGHVRLVVTGTAGNDSVRVTQSGNAIVVVANGTQKTFAGPFGDIAIKGQAGNDTIEIEPSVKIRTWSYGGTGSDTIRARGAGRNIVVTIGGGTDDVLGNGVDSSFWSDPNDVVRASTTEVAAKRVHRVASFTNNVSVEASGIRIADPPEYVQRGARPSTRATTLWGVTGPTQFDAQQGTAQICTEVSGWASFAERNPRLVEELATDMGDGTYAVRLANGAYARVDDDILESYYTRPGPGGNLWLPILLKAYAANAGREPITTIDRGVLSESLSATDFQARLADASARGWVRRALSEGLAYPPIDGDPETPGGHDFSVITTFSRSGTLMVRMRNPYGDIFNPMFDVRPNPDNGIVERTLADFRRITLPVRLEEWRLE